MDHKKYGAGIHAEIHTSRYAWEGRQKWPSPEGLQVPKIRPHMVLQGRCVEASEVTAHLLEAQNAEV